MITTEVKPAQVTPEPGATTTSGETKPAAVATTPPAGTVVGDATASTQEAGAAGGGKAAAAAGTETGGTAGAAETKPKPPDKYDLKVPDGPIQLDAADLAHVADVAKKAGWTNEEAQAAVNEHIGVLQAQSDRWLAEVSADKDLGGDNLKETQKLARSVVNRIFPDGDPHREGFLAFQNRGGAGNNINVVRAFARLGKMMAEDGATGGHGLGSGATDPASKLYDKTPVTA